MRLNKNIRYKCKEAKGMAGKMCRDKRKNLQNTDAQVQIARQKRMYKI